MRTELEKQDIVVRIAKEANLPIREVEYVVSRTFEIIAEEMKNGNIVNIAKFGKFEPKRIVKNNTKVLGKMVVDLSYIELIFRPHQTLKDFVNDRKKKKKEPVVGT